MRLKQVVGGGDQLVVSARRDYRQHWRLNQPAHVRLVVRDELEALGKAWRDVQCCGSLQDLDQILADLRNARRGRVTSVIRTSASGRRRASTPAALPLGPPLKNVAEPQRCGSRAMAATGLVCRTTRAHAGPRVPIAHATSGWRAPCADPPSHRGRVRGGAPPPTSLCCASFSASRAEWRS